jgi:hypothetical protein
VKSIRPTRIRLSQAILLGGKPVAQSPKISFPGHDYQLVQGRRDQVLESPGRALAEFITVLRDDLRRESATSAIEFKKEGLRKHDLSRVTVCWHAMDAMGNL